MSDADSKQEKGRFPVQGSGLFHITLAMGKAHVVGRGEPRRPGLSESCTSLVQAALYLRT